MLAFTRGVDQFAISLDEQVESVRLECLIDERVINGELALNIIECSANLREPYPMAATNRCKDVRLHEVDEG